MKKVIMEIRYWSQIYLIPLYLITYLIPRNRKIWVMGSTFGYRFADNPKYFYLFLHQRMRDKVRPIWISRDKSTVKMLRKKGYESYYLRTIRGVWYCLRAKVYLYDNYSKDICFSLSGGAIKINLWHGIPLKKIAKDNIFDRIRNPRNQLERVRWSLRRMTDEKPSDYVLATSEFIKPIFSSAFNTQNVLIANYPRNDYILTNIIENTLTPSEEEVLEELIVRKDSMKVILYMPTFRESETDFFEVINLNRFNIYLKENNFLFYIKLHTKSKLTEKFNRIKSKNIIVIPSTADPYIFLKKADVLVTDYSSIYFDYLLLDRPIIFFNYDIKKYLINSRELYFDYDEFTPGYKVQSMNQLEEALDKALNKSDNDEYITMRRKIKNMVFDSSGNIGCFELYKHINTLLSNTSK